jgi:hypothetical protein
MRVMLSAVVSVGALFVLAAPAAASCAASDLPGHFASAEVVFVGVAEEGQQQGDVLVSPATFRVLEYQKGNGPSTVQVETSTTAHGDGTVTESSVGIRPSAGERWQVFGDTADGGIVRTSICAGSTRLAPQDAGFEATAVALAEPTAARTDAPPPAPDSPGPLSMVALLVACGVGACGAGAVMWGRRRNRARST